MDDNNPIENKDSKTFREKSPFGKHFVNIARFCKTWIDNNHGKKEDPNLCYILELIEYLLTYYLPILPLWSGIVIGPTSVLDKNKNNIIFSNAIVENWMRIVKLNILESKTNLRPGDLIKLSYPSRLSRLSAFQFAFHPRAKKIFKGHKRVRDNLEEQCVEECEKLSRLRTQSASHVTRVASIITDEEIVETGIIRYVLPSFRPPTIDWQISTCKSGSFNFARRYRTLIIIF